MSINSKKYNIIQSSITDQKLDICIQKTEQYVKTLKSDVNENYNLLIRKTVIHVSTCLQEVESFCMDI
jgi:hypothetical protein